MNQRPVIAVDFDGTLCHYDEWLGPTTVGVPITGALDFLRDLHAAGFAVWIFSARAASIEGIDAIYEWLLDHQVQHLVDGVTHEKHYRFYRFVDDRALAFTGANYAEILQQLIPNYNGSTRK